MQPYFMPYLGYISLIKHADQFILFDPVQFIRHGWIERNRILKQNEGWLYIQVPLIKAKNRDTLIKDCLIDNTKNWKSKILAQLQPYKKIAPNYYKVIKLIQDIFSEEFNDITSLNKVCLEKISEYLGFKKELFVLSKMNLEIDTPNAPDEWALNICKKLNADGSVHYINPIGGVEFFDRKKYEDNGIKISFQKMDITPYDQRREEFEAGLSIIDVLMFNSIEEVNLMLDNFELI